MEFMLAESLSKGYAKFNEYRDIFVDYNEILLYYPDYYKTKIELENKSFISKEEVDSYFEENYKNSALYKKLNDLAMAEDEIYEVMKQNKDLKYELFECAFTRYVKECILLCDLIDYIGHYPKTWPVPKEEEKNNEMEALLEKYDIMVRYHMDEEYDLMKITSDDIVRIIEKLKESFSYLNAINALVSEEDWMLQRKISETQFQENINQFIEAADFFPPSNYQKKGRSKREEGKIYLRRQHGKNVI